MAHLVCQVVHGQVQLVGDQAGRLPRAHHELVELPLPKAPLVPVSKCNSLSPFFDVAGHDCCYKAQKPRSAAELFVKGYLSSC